MFTMYYHNAVGGARDGELKERDQRTDRRAESLPCKISHRWSPKGCDR